MLDVSKPEHLVVGGQGGDPDDPDGADDRSGDRAHPTDHHHGHEAQRDVDDEEAARSAERDVGVGAAEQGTTHARQCSRNGEGADLLPGRPHPVGGGGVLVVAHRHDGSPDAAVPEPAGDQEHDGQNDEDHVVVRALAREREREELARDERQVGPVRRGHRSGSARLKKYCCAARAKTNVTTAR